MVLFYVVAGMIFGSFFLVVGSRLPKGESIIKPGSHCEGCNHPLKWYDLIPVVSYISLKGKCRYCRKKLSIIYPFIELFTGLLFGLAYAKYGLSYEFLAACIISSILVIIYVSDFRYYIILDSPIVIGSILILSLKWYYFGFKVMVLSLISGVVLFMFMLLIKFIGDKMFKRESLGGGDIKLSFFIGVVLGLQLAFTSLVIGSFMAFPYAAYVVIKNSNKEIPYGPFLISGTLIVFYFQNIIGNLLSYI